MKWLIPWLLGCALAWANDPAEAARVYFEKLRAKSFKPAVDTAISPTTDKQRMEQIAKQLQRLTADLPADGALTTHRLKIDGDLAAVVFKYGKDINPRNQRAIACALVLRGDTWRAAPVPGSFTNTGAFFDEERQKRILALEQWMEQEQTSALGEMLQAIRDGIQQAAQEIPQDPRLVSNALIDAVRGKKLDVLAAMAGGLSDPPPNNWDKRIAVLEQVCEDNVALPLFWQALKIPHGITVPVHESNQADKAAHVLAQLDAELPIHRPARLRIIRVSWQRQQGIWMLDLPSISYELPNEEDERDDEDDRVYLDRFPQHLRAQAPARAAAPLTETIQAFAATLNKRALPDALAFVDLEATPSIARDACLRVAEQWRDARSIQAGGVTLLGCEVRIDRAISCYGSVNLANAQKIELTFVPWQLREGRWQITHIHETHEAWKELMAWAKAQRPLLEGQWPDAATVQAVVLGDHPAGDAPSEDAARQAVEAWLKTTHAGNLFEALASTAVLKDDRALKNLIERVGREILNAHKLNAKESIVAVHRGGPWACVLLKQETSDSTTFPMLVVVSTPRGARVLPEIDLRTSASRGRRYLNDVTWNHLSRVLPADAIAPLRAAFEEHQKHAAP